jgi:hypothetical protein
MEDMRELLATLRCLEEELHASSARKSDRVAELLADSFIEFGSSGNAYSKAQIIAALSAEVTTEISATDFSVQSITPDVALLTYRACSHSAHDIISLRSSIWQLKAGQWRMLFHQGTLCAGPGRG